MGKRNRRRNNRSNSGADANALVSNPEPAAESERHDNGGFPAASATLYPPGCLHTLTEQERDSPEMNRCLYNFGRYGEFVRSHPSFPSNTPAARVEFWDRPENVAFLNDNLVRVMVFHATKAVTLKEHVAPNWRDVAEGCILDTLPLIGSIKCGSASSFESANIRLAQEGEEVDEDQARAVFAVKAIGDVVFQSYLGLLYVLDQFTPCNCLKQEIAQEEKKLLREDNQEARFVCCVCGEREERPRTYKM